MKVTLILRDPDGVAWGVRNAVQQTLPIHLSKDQSERLLECRTADTHERLKKWIQQEGRLTVELDTITGEAHVLAV